MIADEPTTALDVTIQAQVLELLRELTRKGDTSLILITHDLGVVAGMTQRINVMYAGFVVETATTLDVFAVPRIRTRSGCCTPSRDSMPRRVEAPASRSRVSARPEGGSGRLSIRTTLCLAPRAMLVGEPSARSARSGVRLVTTGASATHLVACFNPPLPEEAAAGRPTRPGFRAAPIPGGIVEPSELASSTRSPRWRRWSRHVMLLPGLSSTMRSCPVPTARTVPASRSSCHPRNGRTADTDPNDHEGGVTPSAMGATAAPWSASRRR